MGSSVCYPLPLTIAQKLPVRNFWELISKKLPIPLPILYYFELIRQALANTLYFTRPRGGGPSLAVKSGGEEAIARNLAPLLPEYDCCCQKYQKDIVATTLLPC